MSPLGGEDHIKIPLLEEGVEMTLHRDVGMIQMITATTAPSKVRSIPLPQQVGDIKVFWSMIRNEKLVPGMPPLPCPSYCR
jgi:hypothetical protein